MMWSMFFFGAYVKQPKPLLTISYDPIHRQVPRCRCWAGPLLAVEMPCLIMPWLPFSARTLQT